MANRTNSTDVVWMWKSNKNPWNSSEETEWRPYSDAEAVIIEEAYGKNWCEVLLDDYHINLKNSVQISNSNANSQRPVKRVQRRVSASEPKLRETRFEVTPIHPATPFTDQGFFLGYMGEIFTMFNISNSNELLEPENRRLLIEKAANGIITEGKLLGKQKEAEWMAQQILNVIDEDNQKVWECCAHLYTMESFLYQKMNEYMRLCGDPQSKTIWKSKMQTFGPLAYILSMFTYAKTYEEIYVYRGANLTDDLIKQFQDNIGAYLMFPALTSTSRNRKKAEQFGNVLFIIHTSTQDGLDVVEFSDYPDEEEIMLKADYTFYIRSCTFDEVKHKWIINISSWKN